MKWIWGFFLGLLMIACKTKENKEDLVMINKKGKIILLPLLPNFDFSVRENKYCMHGLPYFCFLLPENKEKLFFIDQFSMFDPRYIFVQNSSDKNSDYFLEDYQNCRLKKQKNDPILMIDFMPFDLAYRHQISLTIPFELDKENLENLTFFAQKYKKNKELEEITNHYKQQVRYINIAVFFKNLKQQLDLQKYEQLDQAYHQKIFSLFEEEMPDLKQKYIENIKKKADEILNRIRFYNAIVFVDPADFWSFYQNFESAGVLCDTRFLGNQKPNLFFSLQESIRYAFDFLIILNPWILFFCILLLCSPYLVYRLIMFVTKNKKMFGIE